MDTQSHDSDGLVAPTSLVKSFWGGYTKALVGSVVVVLVGVGILLVSLFAVTDLVRAESASSSARIVEYPLPYPGLLPDSPFYKFKAARDRMSLLVTMDPDKKIQKELLFADKRIQAAVVLVESGKEAVGVSTATKAEKYLEHAAKLAIEQQKQGKDQKMMLQKIRDAAIKHAELVAKMQAEVNSDHKTILSLTHKNTLAVLDLVLQAIRE